MPSQRFPLCATDLYQVFETSDVPGGVINIVTGERDGLCKVLADHDQVDAIWYHGTQSGCAMVEEASAANMKRTFTSHGHRREWFDRTQGEGREFLREAVQVKNVWVPYGE